MVVSFKACWSAEFYDMTASSKEKFKSVKTRPISQDPFIFHHMNATDGLKSTQISRLHVFFTVHVLHHPHLEGQLLNAAHIWKPILTGLKTADTRPQSPAGFSFLPANYKSWNPLKIPTQAL